eukprot:201625-Pyramimonas_sp.AAC.1
MLDPSAYLLLAQVHSGASAQTHREKCLPGRALSRTVSHPGTLAVTFAARWHAPGWRCRRTS